MIKKIEGLEEIVCSESRWDSCGSSISSVSDLYYTGLQIQNGWNAQYEE